MIDTYDLNRFFGPRQVLSDVNFSVSPGEFVVLVGPNGAGKTTLLRILSTLSRPTSGRLRVAGLDPARAGAGIRRRIGFLSHRTLLYDDLTAAQNLAFYARLYGVPDADARVAELLERVNLASRGDELVRFYSRGMQQRLAVARAVLHRPPLLLLDEPYTGLDPLAAESLTALLTDLAGEGCTLLLTTHDLHNEVLAGRRVLVLNRGRLVYDGIADVSFLARYRELIQSKARDGAPEVASEKPGRAEADKGDARGAGHGPPTVEVQSLSAYFRDVGAMVFKDLTAELRTKEIFTAMAVFSVLALLIFSFALDLRGSVTQVAAPGVLWTTIAFAGTLGLSRALAREYQTGGMEGLLLAPVERSAIFLGKALGNVALMLAVEVCLVPLATVLFNVSLFQGGMLLALLLGTVAYAMVGTLLAAIAVNTRAREVMLPVLLLPLIVPLLIAAVRLTGGLIEGASLAELQSWIQILVVYNLLMTAVSLLTFDYVIEE